MKVSGLHCCFGPHKHICYRLSTVVLMSSISLCQGSEASLEYPGWALIMLSMLIIIASLPVPIGYLLSFLRGGLSLPVEEGEVEPPRERYYKCNSDEPEPNNHDSPVDADRNRPRSTFLPLGAEHYRLLPQQEDGEEEDDTGV